jgi:hypothetical protein
MSDQTLDQNEHTPDHVVVGAIQYTRWALNGLSRDEVKKIALTAHTERNSNVSRAYLGSSATKQELIDFVLGKPIDHTEASAERIEHHSANAKGDLAATIATAIAGFLPRPDASVSREQLEAIAAESKAYTHERIDALHDSLQAQFEEMVSKVQTKRIVVENTLTGIITDCGIQHERFEALLKRVQIARDAAKLGKFLNIWIVGPAGGGKTTAMENVAKALKMPFEFNGALDSEHKLLGFVDAHGKIVSRPFRRVWENGGLYLFDEIDASLPGACLALNAALANGFCDFPDCKLDRNVDAVLCASGNVWNGPTEEYVGRYRPDAAFSDRFIKFRWDYDEKLERTLAGNDQWVDYVQAVRRRIVAKGVKVVVSPRASIYGALLLSGGVAWSDVVEETLRRGMAEQTWNEIKG